MEQTWTDPPRGNRMEVHLKVVAIVNFVLSVLGFIACVFLLLALGLAGAITGSAGAPAWIPGFLAGLGLLLVILPLAYALLTLFAGIKLNQRKRSGKTLAIVTAILTLFSFPFGTAFGVYALWALFQKETDQLLTA
ncbi:MAG: hypothetical protein ABR562_06575 [Thermoplasmatota archaeon]